MNLDKYLKRTSVRSYLNKKIDQKTIEQLIQVINCSPTSNNGNAYSVIVVKDSKTRKLIAEKLATQKHIAVAPLYFLFCADLNRIEYACKKQKKKIYESDLEQFLTPAGDAYISATFLVNAAIEMGLGTCYTGIVRRFIPEFKKELNLKGRIIPLLGVAIGYPDKINEVKPKINHVYFQKYDLNLVKQEVDKYDEVMLKYYDHRSGNQKPYHTWSSGISDVYQKETNTSINKPVLAVWKTKLDN